MKIWFSTYIINQSKTWYLQFCETQWPWPPLFLPSWLIQWSMGGGGWYNLVFTERRHCVSQNEVWGKGTYITLFSPSDVTAFYRIYTDLNSRSTWCLTLSPESAHYVWYNYWPGAKYRTILAHLSSCITFWCAETINNFIMALDP